MDPVSLDTVVVLGSAWAVVQALATFLTAVLPKHTVVFKAAKAISSGARRPS